jgi:integrase
VERTKQFSGWKDKLIALIKENNHLRSDGQIASNRTREARKEYLFQFMTEIRALGYKIDPAGVGLRHIKAICQKYEADGLSAATIQTRISFLRVFCVWIGKPNMIGDIKEFFEDPNTVKRTYQATHDKSWDIPEVDKYGIIAQLLIEHPYVGYQLLLQDAFGLRRKEAIMFRPLVSILNDKLHITAGAKGGKVRSVPIADDYQREVIAKVLEFVGKKSDHLGDPQYDLKGNIARYSYVVRKFGIKKTGRGALGITGHGLRAGFAMNQMESRGLIPVLRGGELGALDPEVEKRIRLEVSQLLGHNRTKVMTAYSGAMCAIGLARVSAAKAAKLAKVIAVMKPGRKYRFRTIAYELDGRPIPAGTLEMEFAGMNQSSDQQYAFKVRSTERRVNSIPLEIVEIIELVE